MNTISRLTFAICFLAQIISIWATAPNLRFSHISIEGGLPSNCIRGICQDSKGFIWLATDGGLVRIDGRRVRVFNSSNSSLPSSPDNYGFKDNYVMAVLDHGGTLWVGEESGLYRFDTAHEVAIQDSYHQANGKDTPLFHEVRALTYDHSDNIWVTTVNGVYRLEPKTGKLDRINCNGWNGHITSVYVDSQNNIWALTHDHRHGLYILDKKDDQFRSVPLTDVSGRSLQGVALCMYEDTDGNLWLGGTEDTLVRIDPITRVPIPTNLDGKARGINSIHSITQFAPGVLMLGSNNGIHLANVVTGELTHYDHDELNPNSLSNVFVYPIVHDSEGGIWIGTFYGGVNYLAPDLKPFDAFTHSSYRNSISGNVVSRFCELPDKDIIIATEDGGLSRLNPSSGVFSDMKIFPADHGRNIHALAVDEESNLWIGSYGNGITRHNLKTGQTRQYKDLMFPEKSISNSCYSLLINSKGEVYAGTMDGVSRYNKEKDRFEEILNLGALVMDIEETGDGDLWFATQGKGIHSLSPLSGNHRTFRVEDSNLPHNHVNDLHVASDGTLFAATSDGLVRYDRKKKYFISEPISISNKVFFGVVEENGCLWITTPVEMVRYKPGGDTKFYDLSQNATGTPFSTGAMFKSSDGKVYAGTSRGFHSFYPGVIKENKKIPNLAFTGISVNNKEVGVGSEQPIELPEAIGNMQTLEIPSSRNAITITFAALSFANPWMNHYRYKLEGFDKEWTEAGTSNSATYTNLPPGTYTLRVKGSNNDGVWNEEGISLTIKVLPPWYATIWMKFLYFIFLLSIAYSIWKVWQGRTQKQQQEAFERIERDKEKEVYDAKMSFFTMVAHEIRTPLSLIIGPLENLRSKTTDMPAEMKRDLDIMSRNTTRLLELINELLDFKKVEREGLVGEKALTDVPQLLRQVAERFRPTLDTSHIEFSEQIPADGAFNAVVDPESITKLVSNLLNNARKYTKSRIYLNLIHNVDDNAFTISVGDDGPGIPESERGNVFLPFVRIDSDKHPEVGGTGIGLSIVSKVSDAHGGVVAIEESVYGGALFSVTIPVGDMEKMTVTSRSDSDSRLEPIGSKPRMLVVDDNPDMVSFLAYSFADNYEVLTASDGNEALKILSSNEVSIIVSDWMMSGMDGLELCRRVRRDPTMSHIPFVMLTAKTDDAAKVQGTTEGSDVYVEKPFSVDYLKAVVKNLLDIRHRLQEKYAATPLAPMETVATTKVDSEFMQKLDMLIRENLTNSQLSVDFLAEQCNMSRSSFYSKIKEMTDITPNELIQITRLKKAAELLKTGKSRISEICYMVGFNSPSYFSKCFQKQFGIKPSDFISEL